VLHEDGAYKTFLEVVMKTTKKEFLFGIVVMAMAVGLVLGACRWGDYEGQGDAQGATLTLSSGHKWELKVGGELWDKGTYKGKGKTITFTSEDGTTFTGTKKGKKLTVTVPGQGTLEFKKSLAGGTIISDGDVLDVEFADDFDAYDEWMDDAE
jgi:hypothetical protein